MLVKDYHSTLRYTPEERSSHQHRSRSLKSWTAPLIFQNTMDIMHIVQPSTTVIYGHPASFPMKK
jgi:hypothetical protein